MKRVLQVVLVGFLAVAAGFAYDYFRSGGICRAGADAAVASRTEKALNEVTAIYLSANPPFEPSCGGKFLARFLSDRAHPNAGKTPDANAIPSAGVRPVEGLVVDLPQGTKITILTTEGGILLEDIAEQTWFGVYNYSASVQVTFDGVRWSAQTLSSSVRRI